MAYRERLSPPVLWWVVALTVGATFIIAVSVFLGRTAFVVMSLLVLGVVAGVLLGAGQTTKVDASGITVGRATLPWAYVGQATPHDRGETRVRMGAGADPAAYLAYRGFAEESLEIEVADPADPHPYWLVSTRDADRLAQAVTAQREQTA